MDGLEANLCKSLNLLQKKRESITEETKGFVDLAV
jgi:hypothetical protein